MIKLFPVLTITAIGFVASYFLEPLSVQYDSGGWRTLVFFLVEGMRLTINVAQELADLVLRTRDWLHFICSLIPGAFLAWLLDRAIQKLHLPSR
jgi:hypothetical protein